MVFDSSGFGGLFTIAENLQKDSILSQINFANFVYCVKTQAKGQIKPKADRRTVDSPKKQMTEFGVFALLFFTTRRIYGTQICLGGHP